MDDKDARDELKIPLSKEDVQVHKRRVETGVRRIRKVIQEREEVVDEPLLQQKVNIERIPVNRFVEEPPPVRQHDKTTIIPVLEEIMVVEKRLLLKEELHITREMEKVRKPQKVTLRSEEVKTETIEKESPERSH